MPRKNYRQAIYQRRLGLGTGYPERRKRVRNLVPSRHSRPLNRHPAQSWSATRDRYHQQKKQLECPGVERVDGR